MSSNWSETRLRLPPPVRVYPVERDRRQERGEREGRGGRGKQEEGGGGRGKKGESLLNDRLMWL